MANRPWSSTGSQAGSKQADTRVLQHQGAPGGLVGQVAQHLFDLRPPLGGAAEDGLAPRRPVPRPVQFGQEAVVQFVDVGPLEEALRVVLRRLQQVGLLTGEETGLGQEPRDGAGPAAVHAEDDNTCGLPVDRSCSLTQKLPEHGLIYPLNADDQNYGRAAPVAPASRPEARVCDCWACCCATTTATWSKTRCATCASKGHDLVVWDHGSTDETPEVLHRLAGEFVELQSIPRSVDFYGLYQAMSAHLLEDYVSKYDWVSWPDQDEFLEGPDRSRPYRDWLEEVAASPYDWIQFNNFNFWWTDADDPACRVRSSGFAITVFLLTVGRVSGRGGRRRPISASSTTTLPLASVTRGCST